MEQQIKLTCEQSLTLPKRHRLQTLASVRSLITNPNTSNSTLSSLVQTLIRSLQFRLTDSDSCTVHHELTLLADLSVRHPQFSPLISDSLNSNSLLLSSPSPRLTAAALIVNSDHIDDRLFVSLCFAPSVSLRLWLLRNAERFNIRPHLLFTLYLGFTKDPYPYVREAALDGLVCLSKRGIFEDIDLIEGCYFRAVELLRDCEDCVRCAAVGVVNEWGKMLVACGEEKNRADCSDVLFIQLCSMVRDMKMEIRVEALNSLGKVGMVSESILLQSLSKKVLGVMKEKRYYSQGTAECIEVSPSDAAGAFLHGLEDEFYEVRKSACSSLGSLIILSEKFARESLNFLVDVLNDDSVTVRLQALETMHIMANCEYLKVEDIHTHMFLGTLVDNSELVRSYARKIVKLVKTRDMKLFRLFIDSLLESMKKYPQDEADVFSVLFLIGQSHGNFAACILKEVSQEIEPHAEDKFSLDSVRVAAFLVLGISVPLSSEQNLFSIPPRIFSYAVTLLGRISHALSDVINQHSLLAYVSLCSRLSNFSEFEVNREVAPVQDAKSDDTNHSAEVSIGAEIHMQKKTDEVSETRSWIHSKLKEVATSHVRCQLEEEDEIMKSMNLILAKVKNIWSLVKSGSSMEVLRILRACKEEVLTFNAEFHGFDGSLAFTLQYLQVVKLLTKVWEDFVPPKKIHRYEVGELELMLGKMDSRLTELRCRFLGLCREEELNVLELTLVSCLLRLSKGEICCYPTTMKKLSSTVSHIEFLHQQASIEPSDFLTKLKKLLYEIGTFTDDTSYRLPLFNQLLDSFFLKQLMLTGRLKHINAELDVPNNSSENPVIFVSGLPVAVPFEITLSDVSCADRLWLRMTMTDESTQFVFLDPHFVGCCNDVQKFTYVVPFYRTPKAVAFSLRVCIGMECLLEDIHLIKGHGGPKHTLAYLCKEKEVYLSVAYRGGVFSN